MQPDRSDQSDMTSTEERIPREAAVRGKRFEEREKERSQQEEDMKI
jgi:hypothetical protein